MSSTRILLNLFCLIFFLALGVFAIDEKILEKCENFNTTKIRNEGDGWNRFRGAHVISTCILLELEILDSDFDVNWDKANTVDMEFGGYLQNICGIVNREAFPNKFGFGYALYMCLGVDTELKHYAMDLLKKYVEDPRGYFLDKGKQREGSEKDTPLTRMYKDFYSNRVGHQKKFTKQYELRMALEAIGLMLPDGTINWDNYERVIHIGMHQVRDPSAHYVKQKCEQYLDPKNYKWETDYAMNAAFCLMTENSEDNQQSLWEKFKKATDYCVSAAMEVVPPKERPIFSVENGFEPFRRNKEFMHCYVQQLGYIGMNNGVINWAKVELDKTAASKKEYDTEEMRCKQVLYSRHDYIDGSSFGIKAYHCFNIFRLPFDYLFNTVEKIKARMTLAEEICSAAASSSGSARYEELKQKETSCFMEQLHYRIGEKWNWRMIYSDLAAFESFPGLKSIRTESPETSIADLTTLMNDIWKKDATLLTLSDRVEKAEKICLERTAIVYEITADINDQGCYFMCTLQMLDLYYDGSFCLERYIEDWNLVYNIKSSNPPRNPSEFIGDSCKIAGNIFEKIKLSNLITKLKETVKNL